jgi:hypothetical protein
MKQALLVLLLLLLPLSSIAAPAETNPKDPNPKGKLFIARQPCNTIEEMFRILIQHEERLLFTGKGMVFSYQNGQAYWNQTMVFTNQDNSSFTVVATYPDGTACMIMNGREFAPYSGNQPYENLIKPPKDQL